MARRDAGARRTRAAARFRSLRALSVRRCSFGSPRDRLPAARPSLLNRSVGAYLTWLRLYEGLLLRSGALTSVERGIPLYGRFMRPALEVVLWWERRRIPFNLAVLTAGIVSGLTVLLIGGRLVHLGEDVVSPLLSSPGLRCTPSLRTPATAWAGSPSCCGAAATLLAPRRSGDACFASVSGSRLA